MIELDNLTIGYKDRVLLDRATLQIPAARLVALLGRNGAGKSTLMRVVSGLQPPVSGGVRLLGEDLLTIDDVRRAGLVSVVTTERVRIPNMSCRSMVALGRSPYTNWLGRMSDEDQALVDESLSLVGMLEFANKSCATLSDGELQRVLIARALAQQTPIIMLDEPTAFLDITSRHRLMELLRGLVVDHQKTIIFSTHELSLALECCDLVMLISQGSLHLHAPLALRSGDLLSRVFDCPLGF